MCGRYTLKTPKAALNEHFGVMLSEMERYNIAPSLPVPAITHDAVKVLKWGFVPSWSKEPTVKFSNINTSCETVATNAAYRGSFRHKHCLMPAGGFFDRAPGKLKVPHHCRLAGGGPFAFAGIWDSWRDELETCALISTSVIEVVARAHDRMPVILRREDYGAWLDPKATNDELMGLLVPLPSELMVGYPVGLAVNRPAFDGPG